MFERLRFGTILLTLGLLTACVGNGGPPADPDNPPLNTQARCETDLAPEVQPPQGYAALLEANARFAARFFAESLKEAPGTNLFLSPLSASIALSMLYQGASGSTREAMAGALEVGDLSLEHLNAAHAHLRQAIASPNGCVSLRLANSLWLHQSFPVRDSFVQANTRTFAAEVRSLDLRAASAAPTINAWVDGKTGGMIREVLDPQKRIEEVFFLINATYFAGTWERVFKPEDTSARAFALEGGGSQQVQMMRRDLAGESYGETAELQVLRVPYKSDGKRVYQMELLLPRAGVSLSSVLPILLNTSIPTPFVAAGRLELPRFKLASELDLKKPLERMGLGLLFTDQANFSGISDVPTLISKALQKTALEVNEEGTKAAAVTVIGGTPTSVPITKQVNLVFDRPFFLKIVEARSGTVVFMGAVYRPTSE